MDSWARLNFSRPNQGVQTKGPIGQWNIIGGVLLPSQRRIVGRSRSRSTTSEETEAVPRFLAVATKGLPLKYLIVFLLWAMRANSLEERRPVSSLPTSMDVVESLTQLGQFSVHSLTIKHQETREALLAEHSLQVRAIDKLGVAGFAYEEVVREGVERFPAKSWQTGHVKQHEFSPPGPKSLERRE